jgi:DNA repair protein SbcD/Mre11
MKILHTADWHIGKRLDRFSRLDEQRDVLAEIAEIADTEAVDLVLVAGDLYDTVNPGSESEELLYTALTALSRDGRRPVVAVAGNHDSPDRVNAPDVLARRHGILMTGYPVATTGPIEGSGGFSLRSVVPGLVEINWSDNRHPPVRIILTPYANEVRLRRALIPGETSSGDDLLTAALKTHWEELTEEHMQGEGINLLLTHLFFAADPSSPPEEPESERPIGHVGGAPAMSPNIVPRQVQYVACGHLHRPHTLAGAVPVRYAGSPLSYSFSEAEQDKGVTIIEIEGRGRLGDTPDIREVALRTGFPLRRHTAGSVDGALAWLQENQDCYVELTVDLPDYLSGSDRNLLHRTHPRIVTIIPRRKDEDIQVPRRTIDPAGDIRELFAQYFARTHGTPPGEELRQLLEEVLGEARK